MKDKKGAKVIRQAKFMEAYAKQGGFILTSCEAAGITRKTYYEWRKEQGFADKLAIVNEQLEMKYCAALDRLVAKGNLGAIIFKLKSLNPERYDDQARRAHIEASKIEDNRRPVTIILNRGTTRPSQLSEENAIRDEDSDPITP